MIKSIYLFILTYFLEISDESVHVPVRAPVRVPFEPINAKNTNNMTHHQEDQNLIYNDNLDYTSTSHIIHQRPLYNMDQVSNRKPANISIQSKFKNQNLIYDTHSPVEMDQASIYNSDHSIQSQFKEQNLIYDIHSPVENMNRLQASTSNTDLRYYNKTPLHNVNTHHPHQFNNIRHNINPDTESEIFKNSTTSERHQQYRNWSQKTAMPLSGRSASYSSTNLPVDSYTGTTQEFGIDSQELFFPDEKSLVNWLYTRPDLIAQAQSPSITHFSPYKVCSMLFNCKLLISVLFLNYIIYY